MSIEVCNPYGESWRVYFTEDPSEVAQSPQWGEHSVGWTTRLFPDAEAIAHRYAKMLRVPGYYERVVAHFTSVTYEPLWVKPCGCHEEVRTKGEHWWVEGEDCLHARFMRRVGAA